MTPEPDSAEIELSIVTAARNECGNVEAFLQGSLTALRELGVTAEIVYVDDGSIDGTHASVEAFISAHDDAPIRLMRHPRPRGLSAAIVTGVANARGKLLCLVPADLESLPQEDIPLLYRAVDDHTDVVCGRRLRRGDGKELASRIFAIANDWLFGVQVHDSNWIKLVRRDMLDDLRLYPGWHRFLVAMLMAQGCRIKEVETVWHRRQFGRSKYGFARIPEGLACAIAVRLFLKYRGRPLLFFLRVWSWAVLIGVVGLVLAVMQGPASWLWLPAWLGCAASATLAGMALTIGIGLEFARWERHDVDPMLVRTPPQAVP